MHGKPERAENKDETETHRSDSVAHLDQHGQVHVLALGRDASRVLGAALLVLLQINTLRDEKHRHRYDW